MSEPGRREAVLTARGITKTFPGVTALRDVSFDLRAGEIHALCGENGAGKSTLIKLLSGVHPHGSYEGVLEVGGRETRLESIADAERAGLAVIHQELALVEELTVAENLFLGAEPRRGGGLSWLIDWDRVRREARELLARFGVALDPDLPCARLGVGQKQLVEILKALRKESRVLILDEPTAALAEHEVQVLLRILRELRARGVACIYISHKLEEVFALADRITVLRDGATVATLDASQTTATEVIRHMVGREITELFPRRRAGAQQLDSPFLRDLIAHPEKALALCTRGEAILLNADAFVDLAPEYRALPREQQRVLHGRLHPLGRQARDRAFELRLSRPAAPGEVIHFTAGGPASGKTTFSTLIRGCIYDSNLANQEHAEMMIDQVFRSGRGVAVHFVYRPMAEAVAANVQRYLATGRAPNVRIMAKCHADARRVVEHIIAKYVPTGRVRVSIRVNAAGRLAVVAPAQFAAEWPVRSVDHLEAAGNDVVHEQLASGAIDGGLADFLRGGAGSSNARSGPRHGGSEPARGGGEAARDSAARADSGAVTAPALRVEKLSVADARTGALFLHDISLEVAPGEVLGIGGLMGAGRTELLMHLFGAWGVRRGGRVELEGSELPTLPPAEVLRRGLALVSEDRRRYGLVGEGSVAFNLSLSSLRSLTRGVFIDSSREFRRNDDLFRSLRVKAPSLDAPVRKLSGGNQQKVVLGKALMTDPRVIFLDEPTRGIDVGAKIEIYEIINRLTDAGKAVVLVSSELPELIGMSDRILMLHEGRVGGVFDREEATQERLLAAALGNQIAA